ncbi:MAG: phosphate signaling complex protein PhoU [Kiritimatiellia bacterium]
MPVLHLHREVIQLNKLILQLGGQVEENLRQCVQAMQNRDSRQNTTDIVDEDLLVDSLEVRVEEECLKILALYQPVASDLRYIVAVLKINGDLERIGDLSSSLARHSTVLRQKKQLPIPSQIHTLSGLSRDMLNQGLNALVERNVERCRRILHTEKQVDTLYHEVREWFYQQIKQHPEDVSTYLDIFLAAKDLERIADHACNIAEDVIYLITGEIVRHHALDEED